jgi:hypothetical protein
MSKRASSRGKKINPHFWVFCEGETEEAYVAFLRSYYRIPIEIVTRVVGNRITKKYINHYKEARNTHPKDRDFLMYDADVPDTLEKLKEIDKAILIASNPCIELWFLLHYKNITTPISGKECIHELCNRNRNRYAKGVLDEMLKSNLIENQNTACKRAKTFVNFKNPSSNMYVFIEEIEKAKKQ